MPKMDGPGKQIKVWLPTHLLSALAQDAKAEGQTYIQPVLRRILGQHYQEQARAAGLNTQIEAPSNSG